MNLLMALVLWLFSLFMPLLQDGASLWQAYEMLLHANTYTHAYLFLTLLFMVLGVELVMTLSKEYRLFSSILFSMALFLLYTYCPYLPFLMFALLFLFGGFLPLLSEKPAVIKAAIPEVAPAVEESAAIVEENETPAVYTAIDDDTMIAEVEAFIDSLFDEPYQTLAVMTKDATEMEKEILDDANEILEEAFTADEPLPKDQVTSSQEEPAVHDEIEEEMMKLEDQPEAYDEEISWQDMLGEK